MCQELSRSKIFHLYEHEREVFDVPVDLERMQALLLSSSLQIEDADDKHRHSNKIVQNRADLVAFSIMCKSSPKKGRLPKIMSMNSKVCVVNSASPDLTNSYRRFMGRARMFHST